MFNGWESITALVAAILIAYAVVLSLGTIVWTYRDIEERTRDGWAQTVAVLLVVVFNLPGLFLYLILRPRETLAEAYERRIEAEAVLRELPEHHACPNCQRQMEDDYLVCPFCRTKLREPCSGCGRGLDLRWAACPFCGALGPQAMTPPAAASPVSRAERRPHSVARAAGGGESEAPPPTPTSNPTLPP